MGLTMKLILFVLIIGSILACSEGPKNLLLQVTHDFKANPKYYNFDLQNITSRVSGDEEIWTGEFVATAKSDLLALYGKELDEPVLEVVHNKKMKSRFEEYIALGICASSSRCVPYTKEGIEKLKQRLMEDDIYKIRIKRGQKIVRPFRKVIPRRF